MALSRAGSATSRAVQLGDDVAGDIDGAGRHCDRITAPKPHSPVGYAARGPVVAGVQPDRGASPALELLAPVLSLDDDPRPTARDQGIVAKWGNSQADVERDARMFAEDNMTASPVALNTIEAGVGPLRASDVVGRLRHLALVFRLSPGREARALFVPKLS
jgi:hypothetical protein